METLKNFIGKKVVIKELFFGRAARDGYPSVVSWGGVINEVSGHMICLYVQKFSDIPFSSTPPCINRWFNTHASTFIAIEE
jgi:hypothetical protein